MIKRTTLYNDLDTYHIIYYNGIIQVIHLKREFIIEGNYANSA